ncbi:MAG: hypothetical protein GY774_05565, partial [Planctomycetes bacterium]|nr:hypothetical protein [Planctomycetota bacterium]
DDGWTLSQNSSFPDTLVEVSNGKLHFIANNTRAKVYNWEWLITEGYANVVEFDLKVIYSGWKAFSVGTVDDDDYNMWYNIESNLILSQCDDGVHAVDKLSVPFDSTTQYNTYKTYIENGIAKLYINGTLMLEQPACQNTPGQIPHAWFGIPRSTGAVADGEHYRFVNDFECCC